MQVYCDMGGAEDVDRAADVDCVEEHGLVFLLVLCFWFSFFLSFLLRNSFVVSSRFLSRSSFLITFSSNHRLKEANTMTIINFIHTDVHIHIVYIV